MAARSSFTRTVGAAITAAWANTIRDHLPTITTSNDVASEGQLCVNTSTDRLVVHNGSGAVELARYGSLTAWTPTVTQSFGVSSTAVNCNYTRSGRWIMGHGRIDMTTSGSSGAQITVDTNLPAPNADRICGSFIYTNSGVAFYTGIVSINTSGRMIFFCHNVTTTLGASPSFAILSGHSLSVVFQYEAASAI